MEPHDGLKNQLRMALQDTIKERLRSLDLMDRRRGSARFLQMLKDEAKRCGRYDHCFSVAILRIPEANSLELCEAMKPRLRSTDVVEVIDCFADRGGRRAAGGQDHWTEIGAILPETDRAGAQIALARVRNILPDTQEVRLGMAVYPEDSTNPEELWNFADSVANKRFGLAA